MGQTKIACLILFTLICMPGIQARSQQTAHLSFEWNERGNWALYEHKDMPWGFVETVYRKDESWNSWTAKIQYMFYRGANLQQIAAGLKSLKSQLQGQYADVRLQDLTDDTLRSKKAVVLLVESGKIREGEPQTVLSLALEHGEGVFVFSVALNAPRMKTDQLAMWMKRFDTVIVVQDPLFGYGRVGLSDAFDRFQTDLMILKQTTMLDERPVWSPDGTKLAVNLAGKWIVLNLNTLHPMSANWKGQEVTLIDSVDESPEEASTVEKWMDSGVFGLRNVQLKSGASLFLAMDGLTNTLILKDSEGTEHVYWKGSMENCHSLAVSPDQRYVAMEAEQTGLVVLRLPLNE